MSFGVRLKVWGDYALFTRPELKVERLTYDVMTPSAARGVLEAVHWKPAIRWAIDAIHVLTPIRHQSIRRNEVGHKAPAGMIKRAMNRGDLEGLGILVDKDRQQRALAGLSQDPHLGRVFATDPNGRQPLQEAVVGDVEIATVCW